MKDKVIYGLIIGTLIPICAYGILLVILDSIKSFGALQGFSTAADFRYRTLSLVAIGMNVFPMQWLNKRRMINTMRGLIFPTFLFVGYWLYSYYDILF